ncbi:MAG: hypothetical protein EOP19_02640, partial [Hyphomicrobiales bacterium]
MSYVDSAAADDFVNAIGTLAGHDVDTGAALNYGIVGGSPSNDPNFTVEKTSAYGKLYVHATTGDYAFVPDDVAINALKAQQTISFDVTVSDGLAMPHPQKLTITLNGANDAPIIAAGGDTGSVAELAGIAGIHGASASGGLEPDSSLLTPAVTAQLATLLTAPAGTKTVLDTIATALSGDYAQAFAVVWDLLDDNYSYYTNAVNEATARLGVEYALYLKAGGRPLLDVVAKYTADGGDAGNAPDRVQSLHDNLLGNVHGPGLADKLLPPGQGGSNPNAPAGVHAAIIALVNTSGLSDLLVRPIYSGNEGAPNNALAFDQDHGLLPVSSGQLNASDADGATLIWSGSSNGTYGNFIVGANGAWSYVLDDSRPATQALTGGQTVSESFTVTVTDADGATATRNVVITVTGADDAPAFAGPGTVYSVEEGSGTILNGATPTGGTVIFTAKASDADAGSTVTYALDSNFGGRFLINATTGAVSIVANSGLLFDHEQASFYDLVVRATGSVGSASATQTVRVNITDVSPESLTYTVGVTPSPVTLTGNSANDKLTINFTTSDDGPAKVTLGTGLDAGYALIDVDGDGVAELRVKGIEDLVFNLDSGNDTLTLSDDLTQAGVSANTITVNGGGGDDTIDASALGNVHVVVNGGDGDDIITSGQTDGDELNGDNGNDTIVISNAAHYGDGEKIDGGNHDVGKFDTLRIETGTTLVLSNLDANVDGIERIELTGASGVNASYQTEGFTIVGSAVANTIIGSSGNDIITGGGGADGITGGAGIDTVTYGTAVTAAEISFAGGVWSITGDGATDAVKGAEVVASSGGTFLLVDQNGSQFATIQSAVNYAKANFPAGEVTILVAPGVYSENVVIDRANTTILGINNHAADANGGRGAESILRTAINDPADANFPGSAVMVVDAANVTIRGLTVDGDGGLSGGLARDGASINAFYGIVNGDANAQNVVIENTIVRNAVYGVTLYNDGTATSGNVIAHNRFENFDTNDSGTAGGIAVLLYNNAYAKVTDNVIVDARVGIQTGNFYSANPGAAAEISGNIIATDRVGIFHNLVYANAGEFTISDNMVTELAGAGFTRGYLVMSLQGSVSTVFEGNDATGLDIGIAVWNSPAGLTIEGGTLNGNDIGVRAYETDVLYGNGATSTVTIERTEIKNSTGSAIAVDDTDGAASSITIIFGNGVDAPLLSGNETVEVRLNGDTASFDAGSFAGDLRITGNGSDNEIKGGSGNDTLDGGAGADSLDGGAGNDTFIVDNAGDSIVEASN